MLGERKKGVEQDSCKVLCCTAQWEKDKRSRNKGRGLLGFPLRGAMGQRREGLLSFPLRGAC